MVDAVKVGLIVGSTRKPRVCRQISQFVVDTVQSITPQSNATVVLKIIDLADWNLPMFDESDIPSQITDLETYDHPHTRAWSREINSYDAFVFVVPQYNWGYPAVVKNAIDYLYNEWKGKAALVVSYGGHGGGKCNKQLREVLQGIRMRTTTRNVELTFPGKEYVMKAARGKDLGLSSSTGSEIWSEERENIEMAWEELLQLALAS